MLHCRPFQHSGVILWRKFWTAAQWNAMVSRNNMEVEWFPKSERYLVISACLCCFPLGKGKALLWPNNLQPCYLQMVSHVMAVISYYMQTIIPAVTWCSCNITVSVWPWYHGPVLWSSTPWSGAEKLNTASGFDIWWFWLFIHSCVQWLRPALMKHSQYQFYTVVFI